MREIYPGLAAPGAKQAQPVNRTIGEIGLRKTLSENRAENWTQVLIYLTKDGLCSGHVNCPYRHLLDFLNGVSIYKWEDNNEEYIRVKEAKIDCLKRRETAKVASLSKDDILFIKPTGNDNIPLLPKQSRKVRLHLSPYLLTGQIHYQRDLHWKSVLDSAFKFFPVTDVETALQPSKIKQSALYIAVNKRHVSFMEEINVYGGMT